MKKKKTITKIIVKLLFFVTAVESFAIFQTKMNKNNAWFFVLFFVFGYVLGIFGLVFFAVFFFVFFFLVLGFFFVFVFVFVMVVFMNFWGGREF